MFTVYEWDSPFKLQEVIANLSLIAPPFMFKLKHKYLNDNKFEFSLRQNYSTGWGAINDVGFKTPPLTGIIEDTMSGCKTSAKADAG